MRCPYGTCDGSGYVVDERLREASECRCMPEQRAQRMAGSLRARIPREYRDASFDHSHINGLPRDAVRIVREYVAALPERLAAGDGLWIAGSVGTGKTWLAMLVARYAIEQGNAVAVYSVPRLLSEIRRTYDGEGVSTLDLLDQLTSVSLLVLDDVGAERTNPWVLEQLYTIINERWQEQRAIVLTTNLDPIQMEDQLGGRAVSRLVGMCETINVDGEDHRVGRHAIDVGRTQFDAPSYPGAPSVGGTLDVGVDLGAPPPLEPRDLERYGGGPTNAPQPRFDPYTGEPVDDRATSLPRFDPQTGEPLLPPSPDGASQGPSSSVGDQHPRDPTAGVRERAAIPPTWGTDPSGAHRPVRRGSDGG